MSDITTNATNRRATAENTVATQTGVKLSPQASSPLSGSDRGVYVDSTTGELFYRDSSGNLTQITTAGTVNGGGGSGNAGIASGGYMAQLTFSPTGGQSTTSTSFVDQTGMVDQNFVTPVGGTHTFIVEGQGYRTTGTATTFRIALNIDGTDYSVASLPLDTTGERHFVGGLITVALAVGTHSIRPRWASGNGSTVNNADPWQVGIQALGGGINGLNVFESTVSADTTITSNFSTFQTTGHTITLTTLDQERVELNYIGSIIGAGSTNAVFGYRIDAGTTVSVFQQTTSTSTRDNVNFTVLTDPLSAGQHTIELMATRGTPTNFTISGSGGGIGIANKFQAKRFAIGGVGAGMIPTSANLSGAFTVTSVAPTLADVTGLSVTFSTQVANESILLSLESSVRTTAGAGALYLAYKLDSGSDVPIMAHSIPAASQAFNASFALPVLIPTTGTHTIKLRASRDTNNVEFLDDGSLTNTRLDVYQFRGGLIPIKNDSNTIVQQPTALNFVGAGITNDNGEAKIIFPSAGTGGYRNQLSYSASGTISTTSGTFGDLSGMSNQTFVTPVTGQHRLSLISKAYNSTAGTGSNLGLQLIIDDITTVDLGEAEISTPTGTGGLAEIYTSEALVTLAAGSHTIRPQWRRTNGSGTPTVIAGAAYAWKLFVDAQGSGISGLDVVETELTSDVVISSAHPTYQATGWSGIVNTLANERVQVNITAYATAAVSAAAIALGYRVDGGTTIPINLEHITTSTQLGSIDKSFFTDALTAGAHTIEIMGARGGAGNWTLEASDTQGKSKLQLVRYKSNGLGAGTLVTSDVITANATTASTSYVDTGLDVTINTIANETVQVAFSGSQFKSSAGVTSSNILGISIDGGTEEGVVTNYFEIAENLVAKDGSFVRNFTIVTAGAHTIKLRMKVDTGTSGISSIAGDREAKLQVTQYRGGLVPISDMTGTTITAPTEIRVDGGIITAYNNTGAKITFPNAAMGGYTNTLTYTAAANSTTSATFVDITGAVNQTFTTPVTGSHNIGLFNGGFYQTGAFNSVYEFAVNIDGTDYAIYKHSINALTSTEYQQNGVVVPITLTAGSHTIRPRWRRVSGSGTLGTDGGFHYININAQGSGINGLEVAETTLASNYTVTGVFVNVEGAGMTDVTGLTKSITTLEGEFLEVNLIATCSLPTGADIFVGYKVDGGSAIDGVAAFVGSVSGGEVPIGFHRFIGPLTAGSHTVQITASSSAGADPTIYADATTSGRSTRLQLIRHKSTPTAAGMIKTEDTYTANKTISSVFPTYEDTGLDVTFTTVANEVINLQYTGSAQQASGSNGSMYLAYQLDGGSDVIVNFEGAETATNAGGNISFTQAITIATAGTHIIKLRAAADSGRTFTMHGSTTGAVTPKLQAIQYRGGYSSPTTFIGSIQRTVSSVSADIDYSSATFTDTGHTITVNTAANEIATLSFTCMTAQITGVAGKALILAYKVDAGPDVVITTYTQASPQAVDTCFSFAMPALTAGSHTIKLRARVDSTPASYRIFGTAGGQSLSELQVIQYGGGNKLIQNTRTNLSSDFSVTSTSYINVTGSVVTFNTIVNETVLLTMSGYAYVNPASIGGTLYLAYSLDGAADVEIHAVSSAAVALAINTSFAIPVTTATAGSHTIQLRAHKSSPSDNWTFNGNSANGGVISLNVLQFGGDGSNNSYGFQSVLSYTGSATTTSSTFADISGMVDQTFFTNATGDHTFSFAPKVWATGGPQATIQIQLIIDGATTLDLGSKECDGDGQVGTFVGYGKISLAAGAHTVRPQWKRTSGTGTANIGFTAPLMIQAQGVGNGPTWISFTPTGSFTTNTTYTGRYRKFGDTLECKMQLLFSGAPNATTLTVNLPVGFTIDTTKVLSTAGFEDLFGSAVCLDTSVEQYHSAQVTYNTTTSVAPLSTGNAFGAGPISNTAPFSFNSTDKIFVSFSVPVL